MWSMKVCFHLDVEEDVLRYHCRVLLLGRNSPRYQRRSRADPLESNSAEKDLEVLVDDELTMSLSQEGQEYP